MAQIWMVKFGESDQQIGSAVLLDMLADGSLQPSNEVREAGTQNWMPADVAARIVRADWRKGASVRKAALWVVAALCLVPGLIMLLDPSMGDANPFGRGELINYHKLTMGVAFTLSGAIFLAAALTFRRD